MSEIMAHRLGQGYLTTGYSLITFEVPDSVDYEVIERSQLPEDWRLFSSYSFSQPLRVSVVSTTADIVITRPLRGSAR